MAHRYYQLHSRSCSSVSVRHCLNRFCTLDGTSLLDQQGKYLELEVSQLPILFYFLYLLGNGINTDVILTAKFIRVFCLFLFVPF